MSPLKMIAFATCCALAFAVCDSLAAVWAKSGSTTALWASLILGPLGYLGFGILNSRMELAVASGVVNGLVIILTALFGIFVLKEQIRLTQLLGLLLIIAGILLATWQTNSNS